MTLAIMQPYVFPYLGYFQLLHAADRFVVYDDVNFIKGGWINRNRILLENKGFLFTVPLQDASPFRKINETLIHSRLYSEWKRKFPKVLFGAYAKAPFFKPVASLVTDILEAGADNIGTFALNSILGVKEYVGLDIEIIPTSGVYKNAHLSGKERVLDICLKEGATTYVNAPGGRSLYSADFFVPRNISLKFIQSGTFSYKQVGDAFVPGLSIIDVLMFNSVSDTRLLLADYILQ